MQDGGGGGERMRPDAAAAGWHLMQAASIDIDIKTSAVCGHRLSSLLLSFLNDIKRHQTNRRT